MKTKRLLTLIFVLVFVVALPLTAFAGCKKGNKNEGNQNEGDGYTVRRTCD